MKFSPVKHPTDKFVALVDEISRRVATDIVEEACRIALARFDARIVIPKLPRRWRGDPAHGLCRPLAGWEDRIKKAVQDYQEPRW